MKKKGILLNTLITVAKALPIALVMGLAVAMIAYVVFANVLPSGYLSESRFLPIEQGNSGLEIVSTEAFYSHVAEGYSQKGGKLSADTLRGILKDAVNSDGSITLCARTANALTSYYIVQTAVESAEYLYSAQGGGITLISAPSVPTTLTQESVTPYALLFGVLASAVVIVLGLCRGLTLWGKISSEKEFSRVSSLPVIGDISSATEVPLSEGKEPVEEDVEI